MAADKRVRDLSWVTRNSAVGLVSVGLLARPLDHSGVVRADGGYDGLGQVISTKCATSLTQVTYILTHLSNIEVLLGGFILRFLERTADDVHFLLINNDCSEAMKVGKRQSVTKENLLVARTRLAP